MVPADLGDELLDAVHAGAAPIPCKDRTRYFNILAKWLDSCQSVNPRTLSDAIRLARSELLRRPVLLD
jgi:hypothetical protein